MRVRDKVPEEGRGSRRRRRGMHLDREKGPDPSHEASIPLSPVLHLPDRLPFVLRDGVPERRRLDVPYPKIGPFPGTESSVLRGGDLVRLELLAQEGNSVQRLEIGQCAAGFRGARQDSRFRHV